MRFHFKVFRQLALKDVKKERVKVLSQIGWLKLVLEPSDSKDCVSFFCYIISQFIEAGYRICVGWGAKSATYKKIVLCGTLNENLEPKLMVFQLKCTCPIVAGRHRKWMILGPLMLIYWTFILCLWSIID